MCLNKTKLDNEPYLVTQLQYNLTLLQKFVTVVHGTFNSALSTGHFLLCTFNYSEWLASTLKASYRTARTCMEPRSVERKLSFAVEVTIAQEL